MIFCSLRKEDNYGRSDLYVSFRKQDGSWTRAKNPGKNVNTSFGAYCPSISPDGKYIFFQSERSGNGDIYWMDAKIIDKLRKK
jgi:Tol biopolymer transport system component